MNDFIYQNATKVYFGRDQLKNLSNEIKLYGNKVLITYGGGTIKKIGLFDKVVNVLNESGIEWMEFGGIEPNPRIETVNAAVALCKKENIEVFLPIGGGSTIDATKAIALVITMMAMSGICGRVKLDLVTLCQLLIF